MKCCSGPLGLLESYVMETDTISDIVDFFSLVLFALFDEEVKSPGN